jgi:hypothetical protein
MQITWPEINQRAISFVHEWKDESYERAEAQTFWNEFFAIFGITRRRLAAFEKYVKLLGETRGFVDLFWKGTLIAEHKSSGKSLDSALVQVMDYFVGINENELPRYVIVSDFRRFRLYDLDKDINWSFDLAELPQHIHLFDFMIGHTRRIWRDEAQVNIQAAELMGKLHDLLKANGYNGHPLELFLVRLMFCLFADDTAIFEKGHFTYYIEERTRPDGSDVGPQLNYIFQILNTSDDKRATNLDEDLSKFTYINGSLFDETLPIPTFDRKTRETLLDCCFFDWSQVSPAIFGSMFQSVMEPKERRDFGVHYTSEKSILKVIKPLFLDGLWDDFGSHKRNKRYLNDLLARIGKMKFLDPACGCGSFLVIAYRELRKLELHIHKQIQQLEGSGETHRDLVLDVVEIFNKDINVDSMYGIDLFEFPVRVAEVALWLVDHQMNIELQREFGFYYARLPLVRSPHIIQGNALRLDWEEIVPKNELSYVFGNPPYAGKGFQSDDQKHDMELVFSNKIRNYRLLDYVCSWYLKAQEYIRGTNTEVAFVSTNSITQGEQVSVLWEHLLAEGLHINFAHRTFDWSNQARGRAGVFVVIIGFATLNRKKKLLFDYPEPFSDPVELHPDNINPYLAAGEDIIVKSRSSPISNVPSIAFGSMPNDGAFLILTDEQKAEYEAKEPQGAKYIRPLVGAKEFLDNKNRWCFWLINADPSEVKKMPILNERIANVKKVRLASSRETTRKLADQPSLFGEIRQPKSSYIAIPLVTSEKRKYIPIAFFEPDIIATNLMSVIEDATWYHFGILQSAMHMAWIRQVCGRLEGRLRYSNIIVYNNFPWPDNPLHQKIQEVSDAAQAVISVRQLYDKASLADLYSPLSMPKQLIDAHRRLDRAVDRCYRAERFATDLERLQFLFELYTKYSDSQVAKGAAHLNSDLSS